MKLIVGAAWTPGSLLIRLFTFSRWSHVGVVFGDMVVEARFPRVRAVSLDDFKRHYPAHELAELPCANEQAAEDWVWSRIGNLYDLGGLFGIVFQRRDWQSSRRDFCSELPVRAALAGGTRYVREAALSRVTPGVLYDLSQ